MTVAGQAPAERHVYRHTTAIQPSHDCQLQRHAARSENIIPGEGKHMARDVDLYREGYGAAVRRQKLPLRRDQLHPLKNGGERGIRTLDTV